MEIKKLSLGQIGTNCYVIWDENSKEAAVIDPGFVDQRIMAIINQNMLNVKYILLTHGHFDHIGGVKEIKNLTGAKVFIHEDEKDSLVDPQKNLSYLTGISIAQDPADGFLLDGDELFLGDLKIDVIYTPGHSKGGVSFLAKDTLFSGDALFNTSIGRTDFSGGDPKELLESIRSKLFVLNDAVKVLPGHGENTTIGYEKKYNPFLIKR
jgi:glyoxylase-like metal-dependent hydrolase (beta-lactamase superfamily II)